MLSAVIPAGLNYPAVRLAPQLVHLKVRSAWIAAGLGFDPQTLDAIRCHLTVASRRRVVSPGTGGPGTVVTASPRGVADALSILSLLGALTDFPILSYIRFMAK